MIKGSIRTSYFRWTEERVALVREMYGKVPTRKIAAMLKANTQCVFVQASKMGVTDPSQKNKRIFQSVPMAIKQRYAEGEAIVDLARELSVHHVTLSRALKRDNVRMRTPREIAMKYLPLANARNKELADLGLKAIIHSAAAQGISVEEWTEFKSTAAQLLANSYEWKRWKWAVFKRDNQTCVMCGKVRKRVREGEPFDPHHIIRKVDRPDLVFVVDNGVVLCRPCHRKTLNKETMFAAQFHAHVSFMNAVAELNP